MKAAIIAALALAASPAAAAPVTYSLAFFDEFDQRVGAGSLTFDPDVQVDLYYDGSDICIPDPADTFCQLAFRWTPMAFRVDMQGQTFVGQQYVEGTFDFAGRGAGGFVFTPGSWSVTDHTFGDGIDMQASLTGGRFGAGFFGPNSDTIQGRFEAMETPLPAAAWLFLSALGGLVFARRR